MLSEIKIFENDRYNIYRYKQTINKIPLMFFDANVLRER